MHNADIKIFCRHHTQVLPVAILLAKLGWSPGIVTVIILMGYTMDVSSFALAGPPLLWLAPLAIQRNMSLHKHMPFIASASSLSRKRHHWTVAPLPFAISSQTLHHHATLKTLLHFFYVAACCDLSFHRLIVLTCAGSWPSLHHSHRRRQHNLWVGRSQPGIC